MNQKPQREYSLAEMEKKTLVELQTLAREKKLEKVSGIRKQDLIMKLLENKTERNGLEYSTGVLEVLSEGYGFLRSNEGCYSKASTTNYRTSKD